MKYEYRVGDVFERLAEIPDGSIDTIVTSPPFLALRSYLSASHPNKAKEIGSEATPADFLDTLLDLTVEFGRVLAPHGSLCVELGDKYSGSGGAGGDYRDGGIREGQNTFGASGGEGWPLPKSKSYLDTLYGACLSYGKNLLTGREVTPWRVRNGITWARPNPPVGALGDKFRPATSHITVACQGPRRWFDLDAVRGAPSPNAHARTAAGVDVRANDGKTAPESNRDTLAILHSTAGAPPLDWHADDHPEDGDWLWKLSTRGYHGAHHAVFPLELPKRLILAMCPIRVCRTCNTPSDRIIEKDTDAESRSSRPVRSKASTRAQRAGRATVETATGRHVDHAVNITTGWTTCGCTGTDGLRLDGYHTGNGWRPGVVLDPFAGSGTTIAAALLTGRSAIGIDIDERNAALAQERVGMFLETDIPTAVNPTADIPARADEPVTRLQDLAAQEALFAS